jgi:hypothetical protein
LIATSALLFAQTPTVPATLADLVGDAGVHPVSATTLIVRLADLTAASGNAAACRIGDASISLASRGQIVAAGGSYHYGSLPALLTAPDIQKWDLSKIYYVCGSGDKLSVQYAQ